MGKKPQVVTFLTNPAPASSTLGSAGLPKFWPCCCVTEARLCPSFPPWQNPPCLWGLSAPWLLWKEFTHSTWFLPFPSPAHPVERDADHSMGDTDPCINCSAFRGLAAMWDTWNHCQTDGDAGQGTGAALWGQGGHLRQGK